MSTQARRNDAARQRNEQIKHLILSIKKTPFTESILSILLNLENEFGIKSFLIYMKFRKKPMEVEDRKRSGHYHNLELSESKPKPIQ